MGTRGEWATDLAKAAGNSNPSASLVNWISAWTKGENTRARFNPLATTLDYGDNDCFNSVCVRNYKTRQQGIDATIQTLRGNHPGYSDILDGIRTNDPQRAAAGLIRAPWGTNGALVQNTWALYDVRNEPLLAESGGVETVSTGKPPDAPAEWHNSGHDAGSVIEHSPPSLKPSAGAYNPPPDAPAGGVRIAYVAAGVLMLFLAGFLIIRQYVPTTQIVKTVAAVAA